MSNIAKPLNRNGFTLPHGLRQEILMAPSRSQSTHSQYTLRNADQYGVRGRGLCPTIAIALGTTGCAVGHKISTAACHEFGRLPKWYSQLFVDAATKEMDIASQDFIDLGVDGAGSVAAVGREMFLKKYPQFVDALKKRFTRLSEMDELLPCDIGKQQATSFVIFTGLGGGTSGGTLEPAVAACHDAAQQLGIAEMRVHVAAIGPEICLNDINRNPTPDQRLLVADNAACNMAKILSDFANPAFKQWQRPDGTTFESRLSEQVWTINVADQSNGQFDFRTLDDFSRMMVRTYLFAMFTDAGKFAADRYRDDVNTGAPGRPLAKP